MAYEDWIKLRKSLENDGRVREMSRTLRKELDSVLGKLVRFWFLADGHANENGVLFGWEKRDVDDHLRCEGFCDAMPADWLTLDGAYVKLPEYLEHNGSTAKTRAVDSKRKRPANKALASVRKTSGKLPSVSGKNPDQRERENKSTSSKIPPTPLEGVRDEVSEEFGSDAFDHYYPAMRDYLRSSGKTYKDYAAFARNWIRREQQGGNGFFRKASSTPRDFMERREARESTAVEKAKALRAAQDAMMSGKKQTPRIEGGN